MIRDLAVRFVDDFLMPLEPALLEREASGKLLRLSLEEQSSLKDIPFLLVVSQANVSVSSCAHIVFSGERGRRKMSVGYIALLRDHSGVRQFNSVAHLSLGAASFIQEAWCLALARTAGKAGAPGVRWWSEGQVDAIARGGYKTRGSCYQQRRRKPAPCFSRALAHPTSGPTGAGIVVSEPFQGWVSRAILAEQIGVQPKWLMAEGLVSRGVGPTLKSPRHICLRKRLLSGGPGMVSESRLGRLIRNHPSPRYQADIAWHSCRGRCIGNNESRLQKRLHTRLVGVRVGMLSHCTGVVCRVRPRFLLYSDRAQEGRPGAAQEAEHHSLSRWCDKRMSRNSGRRPGIWRRHAFSVSTSTSSDS